MASQKMPNSITSILTGFSSHLFPSPDLSFLLVRMPSKITHVPNPCLRLCFQAQTSYKHPVEEFGFCPTDKENHVSKMKTTKARATLR